MNSQTNHACQQQLADWVAATAGGDPVAFAKVYQAAVDQTLRYATNLIKDPGLAEDVTQETFLTLWHSASQYDPTKGSVLGWLLTIAHRKAVDRLRADTARTKRDDRYHRSQAPPGDSTATTALRNVQDDDVKAALDTLTPRQRTCLELLYYGGLTYQEIAQRLDIPLGTAKTRAWDGKQRLRLTLRTQLPVPG